ncbi:hypothetical protein K2X05_09245, partial [bacterium]|nr:hypothetical protein [bacterium]
MKKIKILFHLNQLGYGGTEKAILTFAKNIDRSQFELYLFVPSYKGTVRFYRHKLLSFFNQKYRLRLKQLLVNNMVTFGEFQKVFGKENVILGKWAHLNTLLKKMKIDIIHFNRGAEQDVFTTTAVDIPPEVMVVETNIFARPCNARYWSRLKKSFFVSHYCLSKSPWQQGKGDVLFNPIRAPKESGNLRQQLGIPDDAIVLGQIGRPDLYQDEWVYETYQSNKDLGFYL